MSELLCNIYIVCVCVVYLTEGLVVTGTNPLESGRISKAICPISGNPLTLIYCWLFIATTWKYFECSRFFKQTDAIIESNNS